MIGAITNIILDPFFIFGWCGLPAMGTAGAAVATVIGQAVGAAAGFLFHIRFNRELPIIFKEIRPHGRIIRDIYRIGFPSILMMCIGSLTNYIMNIILGAFTSTAVAVYGVYFKIQSFFFMPVFGINNAAISILAFNFGARKPKRMVRTLRLAIGASLGIMLAGTLVFQFGPELLLSIFKTEPAFMETGVPALRIISIHFPVAAVCIILGATFQSVGIGIYSTISSLCRQLVALLPAAFLLSLTGAVRSVWWAFPIAEVMSLLITTVLFIRVYRKKIKPLEAPVPEPVGSGQNE
jgi:putative MATE family efflux protein